jgi:predicted DNA-binding protein
MEKELNNEMIGFKISSEKKEKLDSIANNMNISSSVLLRQLVDIFFDDPFSLSLHNMIIQSGSESANSNYFLYRCNLNALNSINTDVLDESVKNALIDLINKLAKSTGQNTISKSLQEKVNQKH